LKTRDWVTLQCSALLYTGRLWLQCEQAILDRLLPAASTATVATTTTEVLPERTVRG